MPDLKRQEFDDEIIDLSKSPQMTSLRMAPDEAVQFAQISEKDADGDEDDLWLIKDENNKYLWLVLKEDVKICLENGNIGRATTRKRLSHTNLSGNCEAFSGGELWFRDSMSIYFNGGSSRFKARNREELETVANCFRTSGYSVCSFGWNTELNQPKRTLRRGEINWS